MTTQHIEPTPPPVQKRKGELAAGTHVGEYRILQLHATGGMCDIYAAEHPVIGKKVAVKVLGRRMSSNPQVVDRFMREARAVNAIGHPGIVDIFSYGQLEDGRHYLVMEWLAGEDLFDRLQREPLTLLEGLMVLDQVCEALGAAHAAGFAHRDMKPDNIFLLESPPTSAPGGVTKTGPRVKLLDFGITKLLNPGPGQETAAGFLLGTPAYMSPEQVRGRGVDHRTDIYSLGIVAYEMFCGRHPFNPESWREMARMHLSAPVPAPRTFWPQIPPVLEELVLRMLAKKPEQRPELAEIRATLAGLIAAASRVAEPRPAASWDNDVTRLRHVPEAPPAKWRFTDLAAGLLAHARRAWRPVAMAAGLLLVAAVSAKATERVVNARRAPVAVPPALAAAETPLAPVEPEDGPEAEAGARSAREEPSAASPAKAARGTILVRARTTLSRVELDGRVIARSRRSVRAHVKPGVHRLRLVLSNGREHRRYVQIRAGRVVKVSAPVTRATQLGSRDGTRS